jgi:hypothetical protein
MGQPCRDVPEETVAGEIAGTCTSKDLEAPAQSGAFADNHRDGSLNKTVVPAGRSSYLRPSCGDQAKRTGMPVNNAWPEAAI